jgi:hypothetical protein
LAKRLLVSTPAKGFVNEATAFGLVNSARIVLSSCKPVRRHTRLGVAPAAVPSQLGAAGRPGAGIIGAEAGVPGDTLATPPLGPTGAPIAPGAPVLAPGAPGEAACASTGSTPPGLAWSSTCPAHAASAASPAANANRDPVGLALVMMPSSRVRSFSVA